ncbi:hypothetical protein MAR_022092 [Mya arenaria]|uniref:Mutator-like transposase domain-containing protein n=1 Tax=Mya arenaria TaxID=6604 RepID=A0ABY7DK47_MYAAR|nr:hypothetical protein MAR_022092 [Mya arenaria]
MINLGVGESQISAIFAELNLPGISKTALKAHEREIGPSIESVAEISCTTAIQQEMMLLQAVNSMDPAGDHVETDASADGALQKRGSNSLSGHVTVIGKLSKKCVSYSVAKKTCTTRKVAKRNKMKAKLHSCRKKLEWLVESDGALSHIYLFTGCETKGVEYRTLDNGRRFNHLYSRQAVFISRP